MKESGSPHPLRAPGVLTILVVSIALLLSVTISHSDDLVLTRVRVLVPQSTSSLPFLLMAREHAIPGVDLQVEFFLNHAQALAVLLRGETDLLLSGTSQGWENRLDGSPLVMIDTGVWAVSSLVGRDASLKGFADLKGKRLALPFPGSPLDFQSRALLAFESIDPDKDLTISYGPFAAKRAEAARRPARRRGTARAPCNHGREEEWPHPAHPVLPRVGPAHRGGRRVAAGEPFLPRRVLPGITPRPSAPSYPPGTEASRSVTTNPSEAASRFSASLNTDPAILEEATRNTLLDVPSIAENRTRVLAYYRMVAKYFPAGSRPLDEQFFLAH